MKTLLFKLLSITLVLCSFLTFFTACSKDSSNKDDGGKTECVHKYADDFTCQDRQCLECGEIVLATTEHIYKNGFCDCGKINFNYVDPNLVFTPINNDMEYEVSGYNEDIMSPKLIIPPTYNNKPVTSIGEGAFAVCAIREIIIPDSVTSIDRYAFYACSFLESIEIPDSVTSIGFGAFVYCYSLESIEIPDSVTSIGDNAFYDCDSLTSIIIPDSVTSIGQEAFHSCNSLTIYCEAESQSTNWDNYWNYSNCPVVWDCNNNDVANDGYIYIVVDGMRYALGDNNEAIVARQPLNITEAVIKSNISYKGTNYNVTNI